MKLDIAQQITDRIISELEKGATPWVKPWRYLKQQPGQGMPYNPASGTVYRGVNHFWLGMQPFAIPYYVTFKQAQMLGGNVKADQKGTPVVYWNVHRKETIGDKGESVTSAYAFIKHYYVFNIEQCEGIELPAMPEIPAAYWNACEEADKIVSRLDLSGGVTHAGDSAYYRPSSDAIVMPPQAAFDSREHYYATLLHESVHASGHEKRLKRITPARFGSEEYAFEELVAELGAAMLCGHCGIDGDLRHAGYIESWLKALRNDKKFILSAAAKAQNAMDYLTNAKADEHGEITEAIAA
jgi:antirestriction protein ArdC